MKIGLVIYGSLDTVSGGYLYDRMLVSHLRDRGDEVDIISLPPGDYGFRLLQNLTFRLDRHFDVVLQDELCHPSLLVQNARRRSTPVISIVHNLGTIDAGLGARLSGFSQLVERTYLGGVDGFVFNSQATCASVLALATARKPHVIAQPGGDRLGESSPPAIRARAKDNGPLRLVFLANVVPGKGLDVVLAALRRLSPADCVLDVIGSCDVEPVYARLMQDQAASLRLPVRFRGILEGQALIDVLEQAQALVLPSYYEGFGIAYLEGMAHGLPALGTTAGAIPEVVSHGIDGFLIRPGDSPALASHLETLAKDRCLLANMGIAALGNYQSRPRWSETAALIRRFLADVVQLTASPRA